MFYLILKGAKQKYTISLKILLFNFSHSLLCMEILEWQPKGKVLKPSKQRTGKQVDKLFTCQVNTNEGWQMSFPRKSVSLGAFRSHELMTCKAEKP